MGTSSAIPTKERNHPAIYFQYADTAFLFDCGEGTQRQIQIAGLSFFKIDKIFITHLHGDHVLGLPGLLQTLDFHDKRYIEIYGTKGLKDLVELSTTRCFYINTEDMTVKVFEFEDKPEVFTVFENETFAVKAVGLNHSVPCLGYAFEEKPKFRYDKELVKRFGLKAHNFKELEREGQTVVNGKILKKEELGRTQRGFKFAYITDTYYTENIFKLAEGADYLVLECTFFDEEEYAEAVKHLTLKTFAEKIYPALKNLGVKKIILTHFSRRYKSLEPFERYIREKNLEGVLLAKDFMGFEF